MKLPKRLDRRLGFSLGALGLLLGMVAPAVMPVFASADQITTRSVEMSDATHGATADYTVKFSPVTTGAGYVTILFCDASTGSFEGNDCTAPSGIDTTGVTLDTNGSDGVTDTSNSIDGAHTGNSIVISTALTAPDTMILQGMTNPSATDAPFYARIETFVTSKDATSETDATNAKVATVIANITDFGGVAMSTANAVGVNAAVEESMVFCVSGNNTDTPPTAGCGGGSVVDPSVSLGTQEGSNYILASDGTTSDTSAHPDYVQMSTNALGGAVVYLKSDASSCGGLYLTTDHSECGIKPDTTFGSTLADGAGEFGLTVGASVDEGGTHAGSLDAINNYNDTNPFIDYGGGNSTGVTSPYGSEFLQADTTQGGSAGPIANEYVPVAFYANAAPTTPAGQYTANLDMIAVGTF